MGLFERFSNYIEQDVDNYKASKTTAVIFRVSSIVVGIYFILITALASNIKIWPIAFPAAAFTLVSAFSFFMTYNNRVKAAAVICTSVLFVWSMWCIIFLGHGTGADYIILVIILMLAASEIVSIRVELIISLFMLAVYLVVSVILAFKGPRYEIDSLQNVIFNSVNMTAGFALTILIAYNFAETSKKLVKTLRASGEKLDRLASHDPLTGLKNRRAMMDYLVATNEETGGGSKSPVTVAIGDIDFFKRFNDCYGHDCGDEVLKQLSALFIDYMDGKGEVARWGGEEFLFVFADADVNQAVILMENLVHKIRLMSVRYGGETLRITMTFGVTQLDASQTIDSCISNADRKLYIGKQNGRNRIVHTL